MQGKISDVCIAAEWRKKEEALCVFWIPDLDFQRHVPSMENHFEGHNGAAVSSIVVIMNCSRSLHWVIK